MKKLTTLAASLLMLLLAGTTMTSCGDDDKKGGNTETKNYAHYSLQVAGDLTYFYNVNITYMSLDGVKHTETLQEGTTKWNFDETTLMDVPAFMCKMELVARTDYNVDFSAADYFDFGYSYKCTAYSPTVGIKISSNTYTETVKRDDVKKALETHPYHLIIEFPVEI